jgi:hypothetical protein
VWRRLTPEQRHRLAIEAASTVARRPLTFSHRSAAVLWGLPLVARRTGLLDVLVSTAAGSRTEHGFAKHATAEQELEVEVDDGLRVTSLARTTVDLAASLPFGPAVAVAVVDVALAREVERDELLSLLDRLPDGRARSRGARSIAFGNARSGSPGESLSRVLIHELGFPAPELQHELHDRRGLIGYVDFFWSEFALIGEFDGLAKYVDPEMLGGRTPAEALVDEKRREDRLRGVGPSVARWIWPDLTPARLGPILFDAGLRPVAA